jgi:hypothetical protein
MNEETDDKKIHIDEDWKAQVEAERQALEAQEKLEQDRDERPPLPTANLTGLVSSFVTQAWLALGRIPDPSGEERGIDLDMARYAIDMIEVLKTKTAGNVDEHEEQLFRTALDELRLTYLDAAKAVEQGRAKAAQPPDAPKSRIITP